MVRLNKIYTRTGDKGQTGLATGARIAKDDLRVEAYGTVDEANASIGVAVVEAKRSGQADVARILQSVQNDLFDLGADLAVPADAELDWQPLRLAADKPTQLEALIDQYNADIPPLDSFVLPGGTELAARLHVARTIVRRAERITVSLMQHGAINETCLVYLNRLSDFLFVLSRAVNENGSLDIKWVPGGGAGSG